MRTDVQLRRAIEADLPELLPHVRALHELERLERTAAEREAALRPLLGDSDKGRIYLLRVGTDTVGYVALGFGYSIEFGGRDAYVDELFLAPAYRGQGIGRRVLQLLRSEAVALGLHALHLEVARDNEHAQRLYRSAGFELRARYCLMSARLDTDARPDRQDP